MVLLITSIYVFVFLQCFHFQRTVQQLKKCWVNIKSKRKKELAHETRERLKTGGGPPPDNTTEFPELDLVVPHLSHNVGFLFDNDALQVNNSQLSTEGNI